MFSLEIECLPERLDLLIADLWEQGCTGISELDAGRVRAFFEDAADRESLCARYPSATARREEERDWVQSARDLLQPVSVGTRFFLVPEWRDDPTPPGRFRIAINPGLAFGTGIHETTQLALEARRFSANRRTDSVRSLAAWTSRPVCSRAAVTSASAGNR